MYYMDNNTVVHQNSGQEPQRGTLVNPQSEGLPEKFLLPLSQSDEQLILDAANALKWNVSVPAGCVKIHVQKGVITLRGEVEWEYQKFAAEQAVCYLPGAAAVDSQITVKPKLHSRW
jgi:hypothetical protein